MANITFLLTPSPLVLTGNPINFRIAGKNAFANGILTDYYRLVINSDGTKTALPVSHLEATDEVPSDWVRDNAGVVEKDINYLFQESINGHFTFPEPDSGLVFAHTIIKSFAILVNEKSGIPPVNGTPESSDTYYYMQGKLSDFRQGKLNYLGKSFYNLLQETGMFLTWAPLEKTTDIYAPERLYFPFITAGSYKMVVREYFQDGTVEETTRVTFNANAFQIREFLTSYRKIRTNQSKRLVKYDVWIANSSDAPVSEVRTYILDYRHQNWARYFLFKNSFGVYEVIRTIGPAVKNRPIDKEFTTIPLPINFTHLHRKERQTSVNVDTGYTVNCGFLPDKYHAEWLQELLISDDVYWLKNGEAYPISVKSSKQLVSKDGDYNPSASFEITHALHDDFTEEFVTNEPIIIGDFNIDFNTDFFVGNSIYKNKAISVPFVKQGCSVGYSGTVVNYEVAADKYVSSKSQEDADAQAMAEANAYGQTNANNNGDCVIDSRIEPLLVTIISVTMPSTYKSTDGAITIAVSKGLAPYTFAWNNGLTTQDISGIGAGNYSCTVTDSMGTKVTVSTVLSQPNQTVANDRQSAWFRKQCGFGYSGTQIEYSVEAGAYEAATKAEANQMAIDEINLNGQNYANQRGTCELNPTQNVSISVIRHDSPPSFTEYELEVDSEQGGDIVLNQLSSYPVTILAGKTWFYITGDFNYATINYRGYSESFPKATWFMLELSQSVTIDLY